MSETSNPFTNRGVITNPDDFFGREEQVDHIFTRLQNMQSCSVVGERRIGKSSLLYYLTQKGPQRLGDEYHFLPLDFQGAHLQTALGFLQTVLSRVDGKADRIREDHTLNQNLVAFSDEIDELERNGRRIVLCLDEFENAFKHPEQFTEDFFDHMRSQLNLCKLAFVTATQRSLQTLSLEEKLTSPFYNIFTQVELGEFSEGEAFRFVAAHYDKVNFSDTELKFIVAELQHHPLKLQIECDWVIRNRQRKLSEIALVEEIAGEFENFFVGRFDPRRLLRFKKNVNPELIGKGIATIMKIVSRV